MSNQGSPFTTGINNYLKEKCRQFRFSSNSSDKDSFESDLFSGYSNMMSTTQGRKSRSRISSLKSYDSTDSSNSSTISHGDLTFKSNYRILMMGPRNVGKSSIIHQFLYDQFHEEHTETMDDMFHGEFDWLGRTISFDIHDTSGNYSYEFPAMFNVCLTKADAFIIVFSLEDRSSWEEVSRLRDLIHDVKGAESIPIVVVGNKSDLKTNEDILRECVEATVTFDWENGYVEASAKDGRNINKIFREMLQQAKCQFDLGGSASRTDILSTASGPPPSGKKKHHHYSAIKNSEDYDNAWKRRQSLPAAPIMSSRKYSHSQLRNQLSLDPGKVLEANESDKPRRSSLAVLRRDSCKIS